MYVFLYVCMYVYMYVSMHALWCMFVVKKDNCLLVSNGKRKHNQGLCFGNLL